MTKHKKYIFILSLLITPLLNASLPAIEVTPLYSPRSQGVDAARELAGWSQHVNIFKDSFYGAVSITPEYTQSFRPNRIAECLFGNTSTCNNDCSEYSIAVSGSRVADRGAGDWEADNFYLPTDFQSTINFSPRIKNAIIDVDFYFGLDNLTSGLFVRVDLPINWTRWDLGFCENVTTTGINNYDPGYFNGFDVADGADSIGVERSKLLTSFGQYACGNAPTGITVNGTSPAVVCDPLCYAKICCGSRSKVALADLQLIFGWNFLHCEDYHLGVGILARAPTGNRPTAEYLFEPISGNGGHWELGAQITGHASLWKCEDEHKYLGLYIDANITHLFSAKQKRTFDLKCNPLSRYMLAEKLGTPISGLAGGAVSATAVVPTAQFQNEFSPVANLTTQDVRVSIGIQADIAAQFTYVTGAWNFDVGYNFWGRSCEKISCQTSCCSTSTLCSPCISAPSCTTACANVAFAPNTWGLKGDAYVYGFAAPIITGPTTPVALSATENSATIYVGTNFPSGFAAAGQQNPGVDNAELAWNGVAGVDIVSQPDGTAQTHTSIDPILITATNFDLVGTRGISNKLYAHMSYNFADCDTFNPYLGIGFYGEFGSNSACNSSCTTCSTSCSSSPCINCAVSQWGIWVKGGTSF